MYSSMHVKALNLCVNYGIWLDRLNLILLWTRVLFVMGNCITHKSVISFCLCHLLKLVWCCVWFVLFHSSILNLFTSNFTLILNFYGGKKLLFLVCLIGINWCTCTEVLVVIASRISLLFIPDGRHNLLFGWTSFCVIKI